MSLPHPLVRSQVLRVNDIRPNTWNPNVLDGRALAAARESIQEHGFLDPILVRSRGPRTRRPSYYEVIDGAHRLQLAKELGHETVPALVVDVDDPLAKRLTLALNVHGANDRDRLAALVSDLDALVDRATLLQGLALTEEEVEALISERSQSTDGSAVGAGGSGSEPDDWQHLCFDVPASAARVVEDALAAMAVAGESDDRGVCLERICADYLAGRVPRTP